MASGINANLNMNEYNVIENKWNQVAIGEDELSATPTYPLMEQNNIITPRPGSLCSGYMQEAGGILHLIGGLGNCGMFIHYLMISLFKHHLIIYLLETDKNDVGLWQLSLPQNNWVYNGPALYSTNNHVAVSNPTVWIYNNHIYLFGGEAQTGSKEKFAK